MIVAANDAGEREAENGDDGMSAALSMLLNDFFFRSPLARRYG
jgi:hypothetical protein